MGKPVLLAFADAHVRDTPDEIFALEQIVDAAITYKVKAVIGAGDLIDKQRNRSGAIVPWFKALDRLDEAKIPFLYIQGQHDFDRPPWLSGHRNATHLHKLSVVLGDIMITGLDFLPAGILQEELDQLPDDTDLLICHQVWSDWMGTIAMPQGAFADIPVVTCVFSGDYHKSIKETAHGKDGQLMTVISPGATTQLKIDEPDEHGYILLDADLMATRKKLKSRVFIDWPVMNRPEDLDQFAAEIEPALATAAQKAASLELPELLCVPRLRYTFSYRLTDAVRRVEKLVGTRALLNAKELPPESKTSVSRCIEAVGEVAVTPLSELSAEVDIEAEPEVFQLASALLEAADPAQAFATWKVGYMGE